MPQAAAAIGDHEPATTTAASGGATADLELSAHDGVVELPAREGPIASERGPRGGVHSITCSLHAPAASLRHRRRVCHRSLLARTLTEPRDDYQTATTGRLRLVIADAQVPPLGGDFSPDLDWILRRAVVRSPEGGHPGALELLKELCTGLRTSPYEQLRAVAQQWKDRDQPPGLLWGELTCSQMVPAKKKMLLYGDMYGNPMDRALSL